MCKTIMALNPNQVQVKAIYAQTNAIVERVTKLQLSMKFSDHFFLESNHESLEEYEYN
jgi:hypothetical protein